MFLFILAILVGFALLIWSADHFVDGAASVARHLGVSPLLVGMIVVGFGTSAPEMLVSGVAAYNGNPLMGIGNAIGSNITNIAMVIGVTAFFYKLPVHSRIIQREIPMLLLAETVAFALLYISPFSFLDGIILMAGLGAVLFWMIRSAKLPASGHFREDAVEELPTKLPYRSAILWTIAGLLILLFSSQLLVWGASNVATELGVSDLVIGLTIVAIGTSLPELAATVMSAKKGETDLAVGNIVGSNLFNTLGVLALPALIHHPTEIPDSILTRDLPIMLGLTLLLLIFARGTFQKEKEVIIRWEGTLLMGIFIAYELLLYFSATRPLA